MDLGLGRKFLSISLLMWIRFPRLVGGMRMGVGRKGGSGHRIRVNVRGAILRQLSLNAFLGDLSIKGPMF